MAILTRIKNNQITDSTITGIKFASGTITGNLLASNLTLNSNVTILGNLTVANSYTQLNSVNTYINDPLVVYNNGYTGSPTYDIGMLINRNLNTLAPYGSVNAAFVWKEADVAFEALMTTETGTTTGSINNSGYANVKVGNLTAVSGTINGNLTITGTTAHTGATTFSTITTGGLQAQAIGNVTPGTAAFTTLSATGATTLATGTIGGLQAQAIGNVTPGTAAFTTETVGGLQVQAIGNVTPGSGVFTTITVNGNIITSSGSVGINNANPLYPLDSPGNVRLANLTILGNTITSNTGKIGLGAVSSVVVTGGASGYALTTDGTGNLNFNAGNAIVIGANASGYLVSNAVTLTTTTNVTDAIAQLNQILGKLVPPSPPAFPGTVPLTLTTATTAARITNFSQTDNALGNTYQATAGTTVSAIRTATYTTSNITAVGPGDSGTVTVYWNGQAAGANALVAGGNVSTGNLRIGNNVDYNSVVSTVTAGFWRSFNTFATGTALAGWNTVWIGDSSNSANTNPVLFYYDTTTVVGPTWSNVTTAGTNAVLTTNTVIYSSTIPHITTGSVLRLKGNIANLSGDMYYTSDTFITGTAGGAWQAPTSVAYSGLTPAPATPLVRNLYQSSGSAYLETTSAATATTSFGSSATGPSLTAFNGYGSTAQSFTTALGVTVLYKVGTTTQIEETSIPVNTVGTGSGNGFRILNPGSTNNPAYTGSEAAFNSQTSTLTASDSIVVGSGAQGIITWSQTNYSTGYYPVGPNLSTQAATQYFTLKFVRTAVSKFDIKYTGTIAGLWVALPGLSEQSIYSSSTNGWWDMGTAYAGAGIPGTGSSANGSAGCAVGGNAVFGSLQTNKSVTATFGTLSSTNSTGNEIYVRVALTSGQSLTALTMEAATH
ncbi:hypothetical protein UFOVP112_152 [uncultured Caudovirales phage]|uniref:Uncharacterized protein n=1 Tax=uncultured Caudovirales phage TaxID=2100421 RepID=A0A6J5L3F1_9CAUD|nr:hypothetical protein UFOVP112_152 [uncultured Caudovirales phage]